MKKTSRILLGTAFAAASMCASAQTSQLLVVAKDAEGKVVAEAPVSVESRLIISERGVEVMSGEELSAVFGYADMSSFGFRLDQLSGIGDVRASESLILRQNPVTDNLEFKEYPAAPASMTITDIRGAVRYSAEGWNGEAVNVSALAPGLYLVTVNDTTLKFIKK